MSGEEEEGRRKKEEDVLIESNNPHLAGWEKNVPNHQPVVLDIADIF